VRYGEKTLALRVKRGENRRITSGLVAADQ